MKFHTRFTVTNRSNDSYDNKGMPSMTKTEFAEDCDVNVLVKKYAKVGIDLTATPVSFSDGVVDLPDPMDYKESLDMICDVEDAFDALSAEERARHGNNPLNWLAARFDSAKEKPDEGQSKEDVGGSPLEGKSDKASEALGDSQNI